MLPILFLALTGTGLAQAGNCPNLSGTYSDRDLFLERLEQTGCEKLSWTGSSHPNNPDPPSNSPENTVYNIDCQKHQNLFQMESICWNGKMLEIWSYGKNTFGAWAPYSIRRIYLDADGSGLHDDAYLTDASGAEKRYLRGFYKRSAADASRRLLASHFSADLAFVLKADLSKNETKGKK